MRRTPVHEPQPYGEVCQPFEQASANTFAMRTRCHTRSKALDRSRDTARTSRPSSQVSDLRCVRCVGCSAMSSVERLDRKPNWVSGRRACICYDSVHRTLSLASANRTVGWSGSSTEFDSGMAGGETIMTATPQGSEEPIPGTVRVT